MKKNYVRLHLLLLLYACGSIFSKMAAQETFLSFGFIMNYVMVLMILMVYAFFWQKVLKIIPLNVAMANKAVTVIWGIVFGIIIFHEKVSFWNIIGAVIIIAGIVMVVMADRGAE